MTTDEKARRARSWVYTVEKCIAQSAGVSTLFEVCALDDAAIEETQALLTTARHKMVSVDGKLYVETDAIRPRKIYRQSSESLRDELIRKGILTDD